MSHATEVVMKKQREAERGVPLNGTFAALRTTRCVDGL